MLRNTRGTDERETCRIIAKQQFSCGSKVQRGITRIIASVTEILNMYSALWPERLGEVADAVDRARTFAIMSNHVSSTDAEEMKTLRISIIPRGEGWS
jgi:hypothetical protein